MCIFLDVIDFYLCAGADVDLAQAGSGCVQVDPGRAQIQNVIVNASLRKIYCLVSVFLKHDMFQN